MITNSQIRAWRACQRKHKFRYEDGFRPVVDREVLVFGTLVHSMIEAALTGVPFVAPKEIDPFILVKAEEMVAGYHRHMPPFEGVVAIEATFETPLLDPEFLIQHGGETLAGKIDMIADGGDMLVDHKTTGDDLDDESYWQRLALDSQISQYFLGAESLGFEPVRWTHNVLRKPALRPLKKSAEIKIKKDGTPYANCRLEDETPEEYRLRIRDAILAEPSKYYRRRTITRSDAQLIAHLEDMCATVDQMRSPHRVRNPDACQQYGTCEYWMCCSTGTHPSEHIHDYIKSESLHPELNV